MTTTTFEQHPTPPGYDGEADIITELKQVVHYLMTASDPLSLFPEWDHAAQCINEAIVSLGGEPVNLYPDAEESTFAEDPVDMVPY